MLRQLLAVKNMGGRPWWTGKDVVPRNISEEQHVSLETNYRLLLSLMRLLDHKEAVLEERGTVTDCQTHLSSFDKNLSSLLQAC